MKTSEAPENAGAVVSSEQAVQPRGLGAHWKSLTLLGFLLPAVALVAEKLQSALWPGLPWLTHEAITIGSITIAAVAAASYSLRKVGRALSRHTEAERELALERNVLRTVTDNIPDSIFAKDTQGRYLLANRAFAAIHGMKSPDDLLGKTAFDLFPTEQARAFHTEDLQVMRSGGAIAESERTTQGPDGQVKVLQTTKVPLVDRNGAVVGIVGMHRDITRRKESQRKLLQSEANLAAAQRIAHIGSVELDLVNPNDPEQNPVRWSDELYRIFGYEPGVQEPSRGSFFRLVHPEEREELRQTLDYALREAKPYAIDFRIIRPDGVVRNLHERGDIILDPKTRKPLKIVAIIQDVTDQVQAEVQLQHANRELAKKVDELECRSLEMNLLSEMGSRLQSCKDSDEAFTEISNAAQRLFPGWSGSLFVMSASRTSLEAVAEWGKAAQGERVFAPDDCWALRRGQTQAYRRGEKVAACRHVDVGEAAESLCVPLMAQSEALGILSLQMIGGPGRPEPANESAGQAVRRVAAVLAEQIALALGNLKLRESLKNQSICDALTGLFNRRYMEESLEREFSRASRNKTAVAIVMMDLDHFKKFNDTYGHQAGDALLRAFGDLLRRSTRGQDIACRYGGEEFALVLTDSSLNGAMQRAEILRRQVKQLSVEYGGQLLGAVSLSMGVAAFPEHGITMGDVIRAADQALYNAKREGRDRVSVWSTPVTA